MDVAATGVAAATDRICRISDFIREFARYAMLGEIKAITRFERQSAILSEMGILQQLSANHLLLRQRRPPDSMAVASVPSKLK